ncbi:S-adenosyl-L-methionine-dependent methyltransferase [Mycena kentingensis (nom. inval.)]|nr:S-adenosyl-L-methionine-dependent methyltransferase [Mycena kentingensis (nom. inval.)]
MMTQLLPPPGLDPVLRQYDAGGAGEWLPDAEIRKYTNAFVIQGSDILLGFKKRGLGVNKYNGFGGKVEPGESALDAALRELKEEAGIEAPLELAGTLLFVVPGEKWAHIDIFRAESYSGALTESDEMRPEWFSVDNLPFDSMWDSDRHWLPLLLGKTPFAVRADFERSSPDVYVPRRWWVGVPENSK